MSQIFQQTIEDRFIADERANEAAIEYWSQNESQHSIIAEEAISETLPTHIKLT
jgi:hypothetical protein